MSVEVLDSRVGDVQLRDVMEDDVPIFFEHQLDPEARYMAAFTAKDRADWDAFRAHWAKLLVNDAIKKTILYEGRVAGNVVSFEFEGEPMVGYWLGKEFWGQGIATRALGAFLTYERRRPLYARVVKDNVGSMRVLQKNGFTICGEDKGFAHGRGEEVEEFILELR